MQVNLLHDPAGNTLSLHQPMQRLAFFKLTPPHLLCMRRRDISFAGISIPLAHIPQLLDFQQGDGQVAFPENVRDDMQSSNLLQWTKCPSVQIESGCMGPH